MQILSPEDYAIRYGSAPDRNTISPTGIDASRNLPPLPRGGVSMSERENNSFLSRGVVPDPSSMDAAYQARAYQQSWTDSAFNSIGRGLIGAAGVAVENLSYAFLQWPAELLGVLDEWEANAISEVGRDIKRFGDERLPEYKADPNSINGWDIVSDIIENAVGFGASGLGISGFISGVSKLTKLQRLAKYSSFLKKAGQVEDAGKYILPGIMSNYAEGTMMGFETYREMLEKGYSKEDAKAAADNVRSMNKILMMTDMFQLHGIYRGTKSLRNTVKNPYLWKENMKKAFTTFTAENPIAQSLVEGIEEVVQGVFQREAKYGIESQYGREEAGLYGKDIFGRVKEYFRDTNLWYEGALGFITGGAQSVVMGKVNDLFDNAKYEKIVKEIADLRQDAVNADPVEKAKIENRIKELEIDAANATKMGRYIAQQELIDKNIDYLKKRYTTAGALNAEIEKSFREGKVEDVEVLQDASFAITSFYNMGQGTLDSLERQLKDIIAEELTDEQIQDRGYKSNYKQKAQEDLQTLKKLEDVYLNARAYINQGDVFFNRALDLSYNKSLNAAISVQNEILNGPLDEKGKADKQKGLIAKADAIAKTFGSSEYSLDKHLKNDLILSDIENEAERDRVSKVKDKVEKTKEFSQLLDAQASIKDITEAIENNDNEYKNLTSSKTQRELDAQRKKYAEERKARAEAEIQKKKNVDKQAKRAEETKSEPAKKSDVASTVEEGQKATGEVIDATSVPTETTEKGSVASNPDVQASATDSAVPGSTNKVSDPKDSSAAAVNTATHNNTSASPTVNSETNETIDKADKEIHDKEKTKSAVEDNSYKISTNQRKYRKEKRVTPEGDSYEVFIDEDNEYQGDLQTIANTLDENVKEGTEIVFRAELNALIYNPLNRSEKILFSNLTDDLKKQIEEKTGLAEFAYMPISIYTKDGRHLGFVPSVYSLRDTKHSTLREDIYSKLQDNQEAIGEITYKYEGAHFRLIGPPMNALEAFPETLPMTVVGWEKLYGDTSVEIPVDFRIHGAAFLNTPYGKPIHLKSTNLSEEHINTLMAAIEIFIAINAEGKPIDQLSQTHQELYKLLKSKGFNLGTFAGTNSFLSQYIHIFSPDKVFNLTDEEKKKGYYTSDLAKYVDSKSVDGETSLWDKPLLTLYTNGIAFIQGVKETLPGKIGWSITANNKKLAGSFQWRNELRNMLKNTYYHVGVAHLGSTKALDVKINSRGEITSEEKPYDVMVKSLHKTQYKSTNLGTQENPKYVYTVNPILKFKVKAEEGQQPKTAPAAPAAPVRDNVVEPVSKDKQLRPLYNNMDEAVNNLDIDLNNQLNNIVINGYRNFVQSGASPEVRVYGITEDKTTGKRFASIGFDGNQYEVALIPSQAPSTSQATQKENVSDVFRMIDDGDIRELTQQEIEYVEQEIQKAIEHGSITGSRIVDNFLKPRQYTYAKGKNKTAAVEYLDKRIQEGLSAKQVSPQSATAAAAQPVVQPSKPAAQPAAAINIPSDIKAERDNIERRRKEELNKFKFENKGQNKDAFKSEEAEVSFNINPDGTYSVMVSLKADTSTGYLYNNILSDTKLPTREDALERLKMVLDKINEKINARYDAEYIDKVKKGEFTTYLVKDALIEIGRLTPELGKQIDNAELEALEQGTPTVKEVQSIDAEITDYKVLETFLPTAFNLSYTIRIQNNKTGKKGSYTIDKTGRWIIAKFDDKTGDYEIVDKPLSQKQIINSAKAVFGENFVNKLNSIKSETDKVTEVKGGEKFEKFLELLEKYDAELTALETQKTQGSQFKPAEVVNEKDNAVLSVEMERNNAVEAFMKGTIPSMLSNTAVQKLINAGYTNEEIANMPVAEAFVESINVDFDKSYEDLVSKGTISFNEMIKYLENYNRQSGKVYQKAMAKKAKIQKSQNQSAAEDLYFPNTFVEGEADNMIKKLISTMISKKLIDNAANRNVLDYPGLLKFMNAESDRIEQKIRKILPLPADFKLKRVVYTVGNTANINADVYHFYDLVLGNRTKKNQEMETEFPELVQSSYMKDNVQEYLMRTRKYKLNCR